MAGMTVSFKDSVYDDMKSVYNVGDCILLSELGVFFSTKGIAYKDMGYERMSDFLKELEIGEPGGFLERDSIRKGAGYAAVVYFRGRLTDCAPGRAARRVDIARVDSRIPSSKADDREEKRVAGRHFSAEEEETSIPADAFCDNVYIPFEMMRSIKLQIPEGQNELVFLNNAWKRASEEGSVERFATSTRSGLKFTAFGKEGIEIAISVSAEADPSQKRRWRVVYVSESPLCTTRLKAFAYENEIVDALPALADFALEEGWSPIGWSDVSRPYPFLEHYLGVTFSRVRAQGKVCISCDKRFAAFNTGLLSRYYEDIYATFKSDGTMHGRWHLMGFVTATGSDPSCRLLSEHFSPLPEPPTYFQRKEDLLLDPYAVIQPVYDHILIDNVDRLPLAYLQSLFAADATLRQQLASAVASGGASHAWDTIRKRLPKSSRLYSRMRGDLDAAIKAACRRVRWNFKTAVPIYYPRYDGMNLVVPLNFDGADEASAALVVTRLESGNYRAPTILTMEQAYNDARVVCPPESTWLRC